MNRVAAIGLPEQNLGLQSDSTYVFMQLKSALERVELMMAYFYSSQKFNFCKTKQYTHDVSWSDG